MKTLSFIRSSLGWKLFLSHFIVVALGSIVLAAVAYFHTPTALTNHVVRMQEIVGTDQGLAEDLRSSFVGAMAEILTVSGITAVVATLIVSSFVAWRVVGPIRSLTAATKRIAAGDYRERVETTWNDELSDLAKSFNTMAEALDATEQRRVELIGNLAHELKTPLATIRSIMEGLIDGVLPSDTETFLDVQRETRRLQRLTEELRELSRAEAGEMTLQLEDVDLPRLVQRATSRLEPQYADKGVTLSQLCWENLPPVSADPERMMQVLINLIGNALQYTETGGSVRVECRRQGSYIECSVADTGIGISPEAIPRIFERFYRVDKSRSRAGGGSGIGLTIATHIVRAHGGTLVAKSDGVNRGSTFSFSLPVVNNS